jgi:hypothetical protein
MSTTSPASPVRTDRSRSADSTSPNGDSSHELAGELARLRERFGAYERLDQQLDEMVTGLTDLLRGATELRRRTNQDIAAAIARCEELIAADRTHHRDVLSALLTDLNAVERRSASVTAAVANLQTELAGITRRLPSRNASADPMSASDHQPSASPEAPSTLTLMVRGVPSVAAALALQRYIAGLGTVAEIQTREYAAGELRLHLELSGHFAVADLRGLPNGALEVAEEHPDRLVLLYVPSAHG